MFAMTGTVTQMKPMLFLFYCKFSTFACKRMCVSVCLCVREASALILEIFYHLLLVLDKQIDFWILTLISTIQSIRMNTRFNPIRTYTFNCIKSHSFLFDRIISTLSEYSDELEFVPIVWVLHLFVKKKWIYSQIIFPFTHLTADGLQSNCVYVHLLIG